MKKVRRGRCLGVFALGLAMIGSVGCQTWTYTSGMTLPSERYLQHRPQYFPPSPDFPHERELAYMQQQQAGGPAPAAGLPGAPVVPPPP